MGAPKNATRNQYKNNAGEIEARSAAERLGLTAEERRNSLLSGCQRIEYGKRHPICGWRFFMFKNDWKQGGKLMKLTEVLQRAEKLYPHHYDDEELLEWCWELTNEIADKYKKLYGVVEWFAPEGKLSNGQPRESQARKSQFQLPPGIRWEDVEAVYVDGRKVAKVDARSFRQAYAGKNVKLVYRIRPEPYCNPVISEETAGEFKVTGKWITLPAAVQFAIGDRLDIWRESAQKARYRVFDFDPETYTYTLDREIATAGTGLYHVQRVLDAVTPVPPPFDMMYIDYVLAKICYYQNDLEGYNKHMSMVNAHMQDYAYWYKQTNPIRQTRFVNQW